jgi:hypothetical protein
MVLKLRHSLLHLKPFIYLFPFWCLSVLCMGSALENKTRTEQVTLLFGLPDCWLGVSVYPEGPAAGHLDTGFLGFQANLRYSQVPSWYCVLPMQPSRLKCITFPPLAQEL